jgi:hypothetical protein
MPSLVETLKRYVFNPASQYCQYHQLRLADPKRHLLSFLNSRMDEIRLWHADQYSKIVLSQNELADIHCFRLGIIRREMSGKVSYSKHRDHSAHTLHNYLIGWYIFENSMRISDVFADHLQKRCIGSLWPLVGLMHDIGYIFEGGIDPIDPEGKNQNLVYGVDLLNEYFGHRFWDCFGLATNDIRETVKNFAGTRFPSFRECSLHTVSNELLTLGNNDLLREKIKAQRERLGHPPPARDFLSEPSGLASDIFGLWNRHYEYFYGPTGMTARIPKMRDFFIASSSEGEKPSGLRTLNHGISSGLIILQCLTLFHKFKLDIDKAAASLPLNPEMREILISIANKLSEYGSDNRKDIWWWWTSIVWATAAVAFHDTLITMTEDPADPNAQPILRLEEDPLTYLGILVDCLQEWDRASVNRSSIIRGDIPIQSSDISLTSSGGKVIIGFRRGAHSGKVEKALNRTLHGWDQLVVLRQLP